jgi:hypothetical protein
LRQSTFLDKEKKEIIFSSSAIKFLLTEVKPNKHRCSVCFSIICFIKVYPQLRTLPKAKISSFITKRVVREGIITERR